MTNNEIKSFFQKHGEKGLRDFSKFASTATTFQVVSNGLGNLLEGTGVLVNEVDMSRLLSEKFCNMTAYSSPAEFQKWLLLRQEGGARSLANALSRVQGDYGEATLMRQLQGEIKSLLFKPTFPTNEAGRIVSTTPGIDIEIRNRLTNKVVERIQVKTVSSPDSIQGIIKSLTENKDFLPTDTLAGPKELIEAAKEAGLQNKMLEVGTVGDTQTTREQLKNKILSGQIRTDYTPSEVIGKMGQGAIVGCVVRVGISGLTNYIGYRKGNITAKDAVREVAEDGVKGAVSGAVLTGASIILPAGALGLVGGLAIGMYMEALLSNILDEVFGKGAYHEILTASGYIMGTSMHLSAAMKEFADDRKDVRESFELIEKSQRQIAASIKETNKKSEVL